MDETNNTNEPASAIGTGISVRAFLPSDDAAWEQYVLAHPQATVFHRQAWSKAVAAAYGHEACHLVAWADEQVVGLLPMFFVKSAFVGRVLVSVPYATYGGILADCDDVAQAILHAAEGLSEQRDTEYIELRHRDPSSLDLPEITRYDTFRKQLPARPEDVLPTFPKKGRAAARNGLKTLRVEVGPQWLDAVYDLYALTLRRLGSPNYKRKLFHELQRNYGDDCVSLVVLNGDKVVAGVISYVFRDELVAYFSGSLPEAKRLSASNVMYLKLMEYCVSRGLAWFDFNRTRRDNNGPHSFKRHLGFTPSPLHYQMALNRATELPNLSPSNKKFALAGKVWRKMPLWFTRQAGEFITRWIP